MTVLNNADKIMLGSSVVSRVYLGANLVWSADPLGAWHTALAGAATAQARLMVVSDSILEGTGASTRRKRVIDLMLDDLVRDNPVTGYGRSGYLPAHFAIPNTITPWAPDWYTSKSGTVTPYNGGIQGQSGTQSNTYGLGQRSSDMAAGAILTYTVYGTDIDIWTAAGGSFQVSIDGGAYSTTVDTSGRNAYADITQKSLGASGTHTVAIKCITGTVHFLGMTVYDGGRAKGIVLYDASHYGTDTPGMYDSSTPSAPQNSKFVRGLQLVDPHLVLLDLGKNYLSSTTIAIQVAAYSGLIDAVRATLPSASILLMAVYNQLVGSGSIDSAGETYAQYKAALLAMASGKNLPVLKMYDSMPNVYDDDGTYYEPDGLHMKDAGQKLYASVAGAAIDPSYSAPPVPGIGTGESVSSNNATSEAVTTQLSGSTIYAVTGGQIASPTPLTLTDNKGNTYTKIDTLSYGGAYATALWECADAAGGSGHTFTQGGGGTRQTLSMVEVVNGGVLRTSNKQVTIGSAGNSTGPWPSGTVAATAGDLLVGLMFYDYNANPTTANADTANGFVLDTQSTTAVSLHTAIQHKLATATASVSADFYTTATDQIAGTFVYVLALKSA